PAPAPATQPTRVWLDPAAWPRGLFERLLDRRIVLAHGYLDGESATRLCAQLLTLDAEGDDAIRLELQGVDADLSAALTVMGVLDTVRVPVTAYAGGRISGPGLGVLAAAARRVAYPNAVFALSEPQVSFDGPVTALTAQEEQVRVMLDELYARLAEATGQDAAGLRADARQGRLLTATQAVGYGLVHDLADVHNRPPRPDGPEGGGGPVPPPE
ncbi:MAG: ATP-dependent Clp protease proteolytic subunit, partial [Actinobacteria bacterium]|nr:ATP-dependent Clp protease proteolytic subunit [Actinomycetota bacterium]